MTEQGSSVAFCSCSASSSGFTSTSFISVPRSDALLSPDAGGSLMVDDHVTSGVTRNKFESAVSDRATRPNRQRDHGDERSGSLRGNFLLPNFTALPIPLGYHFDPESEPDVLVFLHIQKTGGTTFERHLVSNLDSPTRCKCRQHRKKCDCRNVNNKVWTVNRHSTGWRCGLHADWTELTQCVDSMLDKIEDCHRERR
ncbi:hypothetical protein LSH36_548g00027 [Paralvinella palmiformis]|uniref:Heparan-sulfate 6-O-sulfotransferase n=1 Tax=Paralvinella palmiformis TaxID=53620 RepID=A0AAD9J702_9ANNE|nr:hypothetical protein LSH36_548g00027 [Paralvinella palmiformis]